MPAAVFVSGEPRRRKPAAPQRRSVFERGGLDRGQGLGCDSDLRQPDRPAINAPRQKEMSGFPAKEGHALGGPHRRPHDRPGGAVDPAGEIDRNDGTSGGVHRLHRGERVPGHRTIEPGAEQGIDDDGRTGEIKRGCGTTRAIASMPRPCSPRACRVRLHRAEPDAEAGCRQMACGRRTRRHRYCRGRRSRPPAVRRVPPGDESGDCNAGVFHEFGAGNAGGDGSAVGLCHLCIGEEFDHRGRLPCRRRRRQPRASFDSKWRLNHVHWTEMPPCPRSLCMPIGHSGAILISAARGASGGGLRDRALDGRRGQRPLFPDPSGVGDGPCQ